MYPVLLRIGPLCVYSYGLMVALGILTAVFFSCRHARHRNLPPDKMVDLMFWIVVWGLLGGRVFYVILNFNDYLCVPLEIFKIYKGGLVFQGSLILGLLSAWIFIKKNKLPLLATLDIIFLYLPLAHAIGRIGCFLNGCCFGRPTQVVGGVIFPGHFVRVHPVQLYAAFLLVGIFFALFLIERKKKFDGQVLCFYFIFYGLMRFFIEFIRGDNPSVLGPFSIFQIISMILFFAGLILYFKFKKGSRGK